MADETASAVPPVEAELVWQGGNRFVARAGEAEILLDSPPNDALTPVQALAVALAGCMAIDVAVVLRRSRAEPKSLRLRLAAERAQTDPKRLTKLALHFVVVGDVPADRMERALALSRQKYCSVWHSLRPDIELVTSFDISPAP